MDIQHFDAPWSYAVVDNFLPQELLDEVMEIYNTYDITYTSTGVYSSSIREPLNFQIAEFAKKFIIKSFDKLNVSNRQGSLDNIRNNIVFRNSKHQYHIHADSPQKLLSIVVYLVPEKADGTSIHNIDQSYSHDVEWKINRALAFVPTETTWHSINSKVFTDRITLNINVMID